VVHLRPRKINHAGFDVSIGRSFELDGVSVKQLKKFLRNEQGAELAEYAVGVAILVAIALVVYRVLGSAVNVKMNTVANEVQK
jgi:Flp pilus assembly pilin Flp